jgi:hypothetical protein
MINKLKSELKCIYQTILTYPNTKNEIPDKEKNECMEIFLLF